MAVRHPPIAQMRSLLPTRHPLHQPEIRLLHQPGLAKQILRPRAALQQLVQLLVGNRNRPYSYQEAWPDHKYTEGRTLPFSAATLNDPNPEPPLPPGVIALRTALEAGPLAILALGPLTNIAAKLEGRPDSHGDITRVVAVMGQRPGNLFHPTQDKGSGAVFDHPWLFDCAAVSARIRRELTFWLVPRSSLLVTTAVPDGGSPKASARYCRQAYAGLYDFFTAP